MVTDTGERFHVVEGGGGWVVRDRLRADGTGRAVLVASFYTEAEAQDDAARRNQNWADTNSRVLPPPMVCAVCGDRQRGPWLTDDKGRVLCEHCDSQRGTLTLWPIQFGFDHAGGMQMANRDTPALMEDWEMFPAHLPGLFRGEYRWLRGQGVDRKVARWHVHRMLDMLENGFGWMAHPVEDPDAEIEWDLEDEDEDG